MSLLLEGLNNEQQAAVKTIENTVVAAGAGSGKTTVLAKRYAYLVTEYGIMPDRILTLTFTKKAAAEMYQRIYSTLCDISIKSEGVTKKRAVEAISLFSKAHIQTLDSYCNVIIRNAVYRYGIKPDFQVDNEGIEDSINQKSLPFMLKHRNNKSVKMLAKTTSPDSFAKKLFGATILNHSTVAKEIDFYVHLDIQCETAKKEWNRITTKALDVFNTIKTMYNDINISRSVGFQQKLIEAFDSNDIDDIPTLDFTSEVISEEKIKQITNFLVSLKRVNISLIGQKAITNPFVDLIKEIREYISDLISLANFYFQYDLVASIVPLLIEFQNEVNDYKRNSGLLTFSDASQLAVEVLKELPDIRKIEKESFDAIMIDEFQDDNQLQRDLLFLLAEKNEITSLEIPEPEQLNTHKLFFVGDEKQSIYKFRGADVSVFRKLTDDLHSNGANLVTNYRSHPALIAAFNTIFGGYEYPPKDALDKNQTKDSLIPSVFIEDSQTNPLPLFEAEYRLAIPNPAKVAECSYRKRVHLCLAAVEEDSTEDELEKENIKENSGSDKRTQDKVDDIELLNDKETEASFVALKIKELITGSKGKEPLLPSKIAILFRTTTNQHLYERYLRQCAVPYTCESTAGFFTDGPINDMCALLRLCVYKNDTLAFAVVLKSPFVGLVEEEIEALLILQKKEEVVINVENLLCKGVLSPNSLIKYENFVKQYKTLLEYTKFHSISDSISYVWYKLGYRYETMWNDKVLQYNELYDYLFELGRKADVEQKSLAGFVDLLRDMQHEGKSPDVAEIPLERPDAVQLMTIHKSKGLEFPVVFVCGCSDKAMADKNDEAFYYNDQWGLSLNVPLHSSLINVTKSVSNWFYENAKKEQKAKEEAELRRLLYVAMTRAEKELYLVGHYVSSNESKKEKTFATKFYDFLAPLIKHYETKADNEKPFDIELIKSITREEFISIINENKTTINTRKIVNNNEGKKSFIQKALIQYNLANIVEKSVFVSKKRTPSSLHTSNMTSSLNDEIYEIGKNNSDSVYCSSRSEIDSIIEKYSKYGSENSDNNKDGLSDFTYADFGTIAHSYAESYFTEQDVKISNKVLSILSETDLLKVKQIAKNMTNSFLLSPLGVLAQKAEWRKNEYNFKMRLSTGIIIDGQIDLLFEVNDENSNKKIVYIVDFKTDIAENSEIHEAQLACYSRACKEMRNCETRCFLYYLRSGNQVELTERVKNISLESLVQIN